MTGKKKTDSAERRGKRRKVIQLLLIIVTCTGLLLPPTVAPAAAQTGFSVNGDIPSEATAGEQVSIGASVSIPDVIGDHEQELTITLSVDGEQVSTQTISVKDGATTSVSFEHTFENSGSHTVDIDGEISIAGQSFSDSVSSTIDVSGVETPETTETGDTALPGSTQNIQGAAFAVPESMEDEVDSYRNDLPVDVARNAFVLARNDQLYVVFTSAEPKKGYSTVEGRVLERTISTNGLSFGLIAASSVTIEQSGTPISVGEVLNQPSDFNLELVQVQANHRKISSLTDPDSGNDFTAASSAGVLIENPTTAKDLMNGAASRASPFSVESSSDQLGGNMQAKADSMLNYQPSRLYTFDFETQFWADSESRVDGIVLLPGSQAREFISKFYQTGMVPTGQDRPILYVVESQRDTTEYQGIGGLKSRSNDGDLVSIETNIYGRTVSVQETLETSTACGEEKVQVPTPNGPVCVDVVQDSLVHGGVAWTDVPQNRDDLLLVLGISSRHMDSPSEPIQGRYRVTGEVVSTSRFDESLPEGKMLVVYDLERTGDLQFASMNEEAKNIIEGESSQFDGIIDSQIQQTSTSDEEATTETGQSSAESTESGEEGNPSGQAYTGDNSGENEPDNGFLSGITDLIDDVLDGLGNLLG